MPPMNAPNMPNLKVRNRVVPSARYSVRTRNGASRPNAIQTRNPETNTISTSDREFRGRADVMRAECSSQVRGRPDQRSVVPVRRVQLDRRLSRARRVLARRPRNPRGPQERRSRDRGAVDERAAYPDLLEHESAPARADHTAAPAHDLAAAENGALREL